jgi:hypothetical protein
MEEENKLLRNCMLTMKTMSSEMMLLRLEGRMDQMLYRRLLQMENTSKEEFHYLIMEIAM